MFVCKYKADLIYFNNNYIYNLFWIRQPSYNLVKEILLSANHFMVRQLKMV